MPEELNIDSLSDHELRTKGTGEAYEESDRFIDRDVFDANGERLGRINKCWVDGGKLVGCQLHVDHETQRTHGVENHLAEIQPEWVAEMDEQCIRLNRAAAQVLGKPHEPAPRTEEAHRGSDTFPRKTR